jgi:hypothetical protein
MIANANDDILYLMDTINFMAEQHLTYAFELSMEHERRSRQTSIPRLVRTVTFRSQPEMETTA